MQQHEKFTQTIEHGKECQMCITYQKENRLLRNQLIDCREELSKVKASKELKSGMYVPIVSAKPQILQTYTQVL